MASINYRVVSLDLATLRSSPGAAILEVGTRYNAVTVMALPAGASASLAFGDNKDPIPLTAAGQSFAFLDDCGRPYSVDEALRLTNPAGAGTLTLLVSTGSTVASATAA